MSKSEPHHRRACGLWGFLRGIAQATLVKESPAPSKDQALLLPSATPFYWSREEVENLGGCSASPDAKLTLYAGPRAKQLIRQWILEGGRRPHALLRPSVRNETHPPSAHG